MDTRLFLMSGGLFEREHRRRMGIALWEFGYLVARINEEVADGEGDFSGIVAHGEPISASEIANHLGMTVWTTRNNLRRLEREGYISRRMKSGDSYTYTIRHSKKFLPVRKRNAACEEIADPTEGENSNPGQNMPGPSEKTSAPRGENLIPNKEIISNKNKYISSKPSASGPDLDSALASVWSHYIFIVGRNEKTYAFTSERRQKGMARLRECLRKTGGNLENAVALAKLAVDGLAKSDWHMGRDPKTNGKLYCDWSKHLFKSYERMEEWWNQ